jgi:regulator of cell morphogenesis and NO signaling
MIDLTTMTVRDIALAAPSTTRVFEEYNIDFCCGGRKALAEACALAGADERAVAEKLTELLEGPQSADDPEKLELPELVNYILDKHHEFTRTEMLRLTGLMEKVAWKHSDKHPELFELKENFAILTNDLIGHMRKEEMMLFPYIQDLVRAKARSLVPLVPVFGTVSHPINMMQFEHEEAGNILKKIRSLTNDFSVPDDACPSFKALYAGLDELEKDLHQHIHLENNALFPLAIKLEKSVFAVNR